MEGEYRQRSRQDQSPQPEHVGDSIESSNAGWSFGGSTSEHFEEHVRRSVPLYDVGHQLVAAISDFFLANDSVCYDLGCGTGELLANLGGHGAVGERAMSQPKEDRGAL